MTGALTTTLCHTTTKTIYDERGGLQLFVDPKGAKRWFWRTKLLDGKPITLSIGTFPTISLDDARERYAKARLMRDEGKDPTSIKWSAPNAGQTVADHIKEWFSIASAAGRWSNSPDVWRSLERDVIPVIGQKQTRLVTREDCADVVNNIQRRGAITTAHRVADRMIWFFDYCEAKGWIDEDTSPVRKIKRILTDKPPVEEHPAIIGYGDTVDIIPVRKVLNDFEHEVGYPVITLAHRFLALTAARPGMVERATWSQMVDLDGKDPRWVLPRQTMMKIKKRDGKVENKPFVILLSRQAIEVLRYAKKVSGDSPFVFPMEKDSARHISNGGMGARLDAAGYKDRHVPHGWRTSFSSVMNEYRHGYAVEIEMCLDHVAAKGKVKRIYDRGDSRDIRRLLLQEWADLLLEGAVSLDTIMLMPNKKIYDWKARRSAALEGVPDHASQAAAAAESSVRQVAPAVAQSCRPLP